MSIKRCPNIVLIKSCSNCVVIGDFIAGLFNEISIFSRHSELVKPIYWSSYVNKKQVKTSIKKLKIIYNIHHLNYQGHLLNFQMLAECQGHDDR